MDRIGCATLFYLIAVLFVKRYCFLPADEMFNLYEVYKISVDDPQAQVLDYGKWTWEGLEVDEAHIWFRRANLLGKHFK